jgi:uracil-DNA glycosylase family 4
VNDDKYSRLFNLSNEWADCARCGLCKPIGRHRGNLVFGEGNPEAKLVIIGEPPGELEDLSGSPYSGRRGEAIDWMLNEVNSSRDEVFMISVLACRATEDDNPSSDRKAAKDELAACLPRVYEILKIIDPYVVLILGQTPMKALTKLTSLKKITENKNLPSSDVLVPGLMVPITWTGFVSHDPSFLLHNWDEKPGGILHTAFLTWRKAFQVADIYNEQHRGVIAPLRGQDV